jgi:membrane protease YdiL (CAAX protease family)
MLSRKPWLPEIVLMFLGAIFMGVCLANLVALVLHAGHINGFREPDDFGFVLCGSLGMQGVAWILIPIFLRLNETSLRAGFGLDQPGWPKGILLAAGLTILALPVIWCLQAASVSTLEHLGWPQENEAAVDMFLHENTVWGKCYMVFFAVLLAPVAEEFVFRGVLYPFIKQLGSPRAAFVGVSAIFAGIHFDAGTFVPLFVLALFLTWLYERTGCLLASITAHSLFNTANVVMLFILPQINAALQKTGHAPLPQ